MDDKSGCVCIKNQTNCVNNIHSKRRYYYYRYCFTKLNFLGKNPIPCMTRHCQMIENFIIKNLITRTLYVSKM